MSKVKGEAKATHPRVKGCAALAGQKDE